MKKNKRRLGIMIVMTLAMTLLLESNVFANESAVLEDPNWEKVSKYVSERYSELSETEQAELTAKNLSGKVCLVHCCCCECR